MAKEGGIPGGKAAPTLVDGTLSARDVKPQAPFDLWLERGLHQLYDDIAQEPIPAALLDIIEQDRRKR